MRKNLKRLLVGQPLRLSSLAHEKLSILQALPILSSDALSSVAYATEEIIWVLIAVSTAAAAFALPVALGISALILIVAFSYRQIIFAYPAGGGAYTVASENLGTGPGLIAGASLLIDYILTVAVSVASGVDAIASAVPALVPHKVLICCVFILLLLLANLRGVRESGNLFAAPTYVFVVMLFVLIIFGFWKVFVLGHHAVPAVGPLVGSSPELSGFALIWLLARAFSGGCSAMTGIETISNSVQVFKQPEQKNAARAMVVLGLLLLVLFVGISLLATAMGASPTTEQTVLSQVAHNAFEAFPPLYYILQFSTMAVLVLAANSCFTGFPMLASIMARDGFLPRQFAHRGDRLVFSNGIAVLTVVSCLLIVIFHASTHALMPLYATGVFIGFTLSQTGMVVKHLKGAAKSRYGQALINGVGAIITAIVMVTIAATKFAHGAWAVLVLIPLLVAMFLSIKRHYNQIADELRLTDLSKPLAELSHLVVVPVASVNKVVAATLEYAKGLSPEVHAVYVAQDPEATRKMKEKWDKWNPGVPLEILPSPYRSLMEPFLRYLDRTERHHPDTIVTVLLPEFVPSKWWQHLLHNQSALLLKTALLFRPHTVVCSLPYHLGRQHQRGPAPAPAGPKIVEQHPAAPQPPAGPTA